MPSIEPARIEDKIIFVVATTVHTLSNEEASLPKERKKFVPRHRNKAVVVGLMDTEPFGAP
jgi:hypothetical protein